MKAVPELVRHIRDEMGKGSGGAGRTAETSA